MKQLIEQLYPNNVQDVLSGLDELTKKYHFSPSAAHPLTHRDAILITYGDAIQQSGQAPLATLKQFADTQLTDCVSAIHLLPCFPYTSDDGFSVVDYYQIDPNLGDWDNINGLSENFHLMLDAVVNHMSKSSAWFQAFLRNEPPYNDYFTVADPNKDYSKVVRPRALPLLTAFDRNSDTVHVWTTFSEDQIDLNYRSHHVFLQVLDILLFYAHHGAKYIRLDAIAFLWKTDNTTCLHLPEVHQVIQAYRKILDKLHTGVVIITETNVPHKENISYFGDGYNEAHMVYNFSLPPLLAYSLHKGDVSELTQWAQSLQLPSQETCFFNFTASHDGVGVRPLQGILPTEEIDFLANKSEAHGGFISYKNNGDGTRSPYELNCNYMDLLTDPTSDDALRVQRFLLTQSVMLAMPGVPGIYYHSLLGSENDRQAAIDSGINRRINRKKLDYDTVVVELQTPNNLRTNVFSHYKHMLSIRRTEPLFNPYGKASYQQIGQVFIIEREVAGERLFAVHNFSGKAVSIPALTEKGHELLSDEALHSASWELLPYSFKWFKEVV